MGNAAPDVSAVASAREHGLKAREIAAMFGVSESMVNKLLHRAGATNQQDREPTRAELKEQCARHLADLKQERRQ